MTRVIVHIDRLVLQGFRREDRVAIAEGLQRELAVVLGSESAVRALREGGDVPQMRVDAVQVADGQRGERVGESVARRIGAEVVE